MCICGIRARVRPRYELGWGDVAREVRLLCRPPGLRVYEYRLGKIEYLRIEETMVDWHPEARVRSSHTVGLG